MFKFLKDKLKKAISIFSKKVEKEAEIEEVPEEKVEKIVKKEPKKKEKPKAKPEVIKEKPKPKPEIKEEKPKPKKKEEPKPKPKIKKEIVKEEKLEEIPEEEIKAEEKELEKDILELAEIEEPTKKEIKEEKKKEIKEEIIEETEELEKEIPELKEVIKEKPKPKPEIKKEKPKVEKKKPEVKPEIKVEKKPKPEKGITKEEVEEVIEETEELEKEIPELKTVVKEKPEEEVLEETVKKKEEKIPEPPKKEKKSFLKRLFGKKEKKVEEVKKEEPKVEKKKPEVKPEVKEEVKEVPEEPVKKEEKKPEPIVEEKEIKPEPAVEEPKEKKGLFKRIKERFTTIKISEDKFEKLFWELEVVMLENNVAVEVIDKIKADLKAELTTGKVSRKGVYELILDALRKSVEGLFMDQHFNLVKEIKKKKDKPYVIAFIGVNGSGKTTTMAKMAHLLLENNLSVVFAASDTFRAAAIQQLQEHADKLGVKMIKHDYDSDPAAVAFDAVKHAKAKGIDVVMIDTAGRLHSNDNLMNELKKLVRVNNPDLKVFVGESITGNDCIEQAKLFNQAVGIDVIILAKADVDEKGGAAVSVSYVTKKPIIYLGTGQTYDDLTDFKPEIVIKNIGL